MYEIKSNIMSQEIQIILFSSHQQNNMRYDSQEQYEDSYVQLPNIRQKNSPQKKLRPICANLADTQYEVIEQVCDDLCWNIDFEKDRKTWDIKWVDSAVTVQMLNKMQSHQKINHFPGMNVLSRKNNLAKNLYKMQAAYPEHYSFAPRTFLLPQDLSLFRTYSIQSRRRGFLKTYIVKPQASCQGRGIFLTQNPSEIENNGQCVVQTYIENPLLYKGLKFDMRIYALIAGCDPLRIYLYNQGLVRFATEKYEGADQENLDNLYMHLTNYAINKDSPKYVFNQSLQNLSQGHKKSLAEFFQTLKGMGLPAQEYWSSIKDIIVKTIISGQPHLQHEYRVAQPHNPPNNMCFQILGFDFMIDHNNKMYLLEINYTPSFSTDTPLDHLIKSNLIKDTLLLMNVTTQARNQAQKVAKKQLNKRVFTGKTTKLTAEQRQTMTNQYQMQRDQYEKRHLGSFERIFPSKNSGRQQKYQQLLQFSLSDYKQSSSPQKYMRSRRSNSKYRIKRIISNITTTQEDQKEGQSPQVHVKPAETLLPPKKYTNFELQQSPIITRKPVSSINGSSFVYPAGEFKNMEYRRSDNKDIYLRDQVKNMDLSSLKTRNQQATMFSRLPRSNGLLN